MNLCAGVLAAIWLGITIPQYTDTLNIEEVINLPVKAEMEYTISNEEFELLCKCVEAEAGDQGYLGKCYVVDVILNRVENKEFPNDIISVIKQKGQFDVVANGRIYTVPVTEETKQAVRDELKCRTNREMLFFCMYRWFDGWADYMFTYPKNRPHNCHHFYKTKEKK